MTRTLYEDTDFETNGDCSSFQINFYPDAWTRQEISELREKLRDMGFPVYDPPIDEPYSIVFSTLAMDPVKVRVLWP